MRSPRRPSFAASTPSRVKLESLKPLLRYCHGELGFDYLIDISSVDHFENEPRFEMVYELYGLGHHQHLRVKSPVSEEQEVPDRHRRLAHGQLARARDVRHDGHPFRRPSRPAPHPHVGGLSVLPAAEGFPARRQGERDARRGLHRHRARSKAGRSSPRRRDADTIEREPRAKSFE